MVVFPVGLGNFVLQSFLVLDERIYDIDMSISFSSLGYDINLHDVERL